MKRVNLIRLASLFLALLVGAYLHFFGMLFLSASDCPHTQTNHDVCIATMSGFALPDTIPVIPALSVFFFVAIVVVASILFERNRAQCDDVVLPLVGLFRRGILNPKAP